MATKRKVKRYDDGGMADDDVSSFAGTPENDSNAGMAEARAASDAADAKAKSKPAIVTKEQLAKSGYTNLRDYMNAQQGLTRRGGAAPERVASAVKDVKADIKAQESANKEASSGKKEMYRGFDGKMHEKSTEPDMASRIGSAIGRGARSAGSAIADYGRSLLKNPDSKEHGTYRDFSGKVQRYAKGGMTASKRADGIAQRGKTRGTMVGMGKGKR